MQSVQIDQDADPLPRVRLKPKTDARRLRHGFPWVYDNELVTDRRTKARAPGSLAVLEEHGGAQIGLVAVTPGSKIFCRLLDHDVTARIDQAWFAARLCVALAHRARLYQAPFYRLVHAEGDRLPGVVIDRFGEVAVIQPNAAWADQRIEMLAAALQEVTGVTTVIKNASGRARKLEGLDDVSSVLCGQVDGPVDVPMNGAVYQADLMGGQKTGLYYDQRENHAFVAALSEDARVLDVFSHVGGFSLAALANGARSAIAVDGSQAALDLAARGAEAGGVAARFATRRGDAFDVMTTLHEEATEFDVVVCDPPAFAPSKNALEAGLRAYEKVARLGARLVASGGYLVLCSCSHAAQVDRFRAVSLRGAGQSGQPFQLVHTGFAAADHPQHPMLPENSYLKAIVLRHLS